jgi:hypothetical protein
MTLILLLIASASAASAHTLNCGCIILARLLRKVKKTLAMFLCCFDCSTVLVSSLVARLLYGISSVEAFSHWHFSKIGQEKIPMIRLVAAHPFTSCQLFCCLTGILHVQGFSKKWSRVVWLVPRFERDRGREREQ